MITAGIIREIGINKGNFIGNAYKVELNIFQIPGDDNKSNYTYVANCSTIPGLYDSYAVGDVVYVGFLNNNKSLPIILGKIYQGLDNKSNGKLQLKGLSVTGHTELSKNTFIGNIPFSDIQSTIQQNAVLQEKVTYIENKINKVITIKKDTDNIYICLNNFTASDIGSRIFLYRTTRRRQSKKGYHHPSDPNNLKTGVASFGYGYIANKKQGADEAINPDVPIWMPNNGLIKTEWEITQQHIDDGFIRIDYRIDWLPLISYDQETDDFTLFYGSGKRSSGRDSTGSLKIKFGLVDEQENLISLSSETLHMGFRKDAMSSYDPIGGELPYKVKADYKINTSWLYTLIK